LSTPFGKWLRQARKARGLTQLTLSERLACSPEAVGKIETGERRPSAEIAQMLAQCFSVPADELSVFLRFARGEITTEQAALFTHAGNVAPWRALLHPPSNLPAQPNSFIGREGEIATACALLRQEGVRLLTLTGPPGIGKTRLGIQIAEHLLDTFDDGVFFVPLASVSDPNLIALGVSQVLGIAEAGMVDTAEVLRNYLSKRQLLIVFDNFEHVLAGATLLTTLLSSSPRLKIMATSRSLLHLYGEQDFSVPPLTLPAESEVRSIEQLESSEAVRLFTERARALRPGFKVDPHNAAYVAEIVRRLDGIPLAIELAAARARLLSPEAMLPRLESRLDILTGGAGDLTLRHQTLRAAVQWSYDLLSCEEKELFRKLGLFVGGCSLEAIEALCRTQPMSQGKILDMISSLVDKSLLRQEEDKEGTIRFVMLETLREFALERLRECAEEEETRRLYARYFVELAEEAEPHLSRDQQSVRLHALQMEHDNIRAVLQWAYEAAEPEFALRLAGALWLFWQIRGYYAEGYRHLQSALALPYGNSGDRDETALRIRAKAIRGASILARMLSENEVARGHIEASVQIYRELGDSASVADCLNTLALLLKDQDDLHTAYSLLEESLQLKNELGDTRGAAKALGNLGIIAKRLGDHEASERFALESLALFRKLGDQRGVSFLLNNLAILARRRGDYTRAFSLHEESLATKKALQDQRGVTSSLLNLAIVSQDMERYAEAGALIREAIIMCQETEDRLALASCLEELGRVALHENSNGTPPEIRAIILWGGMDRLREVIASPLPSDDLLRFHESLDRVSASLGDDVWRGAWYRGRAMSLSEVINYALHPERVPTGAITSTYAYTEESDG
jgi:predicted ATPase/transcriptional regulator with XRE-family HTH domain